MTEMGVYHGYMRARKKGYAQTRNAELRHGARRGRPSSTGVVNLSGWEELARVWKGPIQHGGERLVN